MRHDPEVATMIKKLKFSTSYENFYYTSGLKIVFSTYLKLIISIYYKKRLEKTSVAILEKMCTKGPKIVIISKR